MKKLIIITSMLFLGACSSMQVVAPKTFEQTYVEAKTTLSVLLEADHASFKAGVIPKATESYVATVIINANQLLESAHTLSKTDMTSATGQINAANTVITSLQQYMNTQGIFQTKTNTTTTK